MYQSFDDYLKYMHDNREKFSDHVFAFATDVNRHRLDSPHTLHDTWVTAITFKENRNKTRPFEPKPTIEIELLGQMHDRDIILTYFEIEKYQFEGFKNSHNLRDTFLGDISAHQVLLNQDGSLLHEILFASKSIINIVCKDFTCIERFHTNDNQAL